MIFLIISCLIATSLAMPADPLPSELLNEPEAEYKGIRDVLQDAASNLGDNVSGIANQVQDQIAHLPQQISQNVLAPIQGIVKPIKENQDSYQITFAIPKPALPSWLPSLPALNSFQLPNFNNWSFSNFLRPSKGRIVPALRSDYYGGEGQNGEDQGLIPENNEENAGQEKQPEVIIIAFAIPNQSYPHPFSWSSLPFFQQPAFNPYAK